ncbi:MAG: PEP-CTERM system histidine kinase PrsK [Lysobacterales bacterium]|nr:MAG: PEP-CTERM system histidine kinase PrsK [Xanthomonadales bacterium]
MLIFSDYGQPGLGELGYGIATLMYLVFAAALATQWRGRLRGAVLVAAVAITAGWTLSAALVAAGVRAALPFYLALETLHAAAWLYFLIVLLRPLILAQQHRHVALAIARPATGALAAALLLVDLLPAVADWLPESLLRDLRIFGHLAMAVGGLVLIEQLFRNTRPEQRWGTKFLYLGVGALFAYDFFLYADTLLFRRMDPAMWAARGFVDAMAVPLIGIAAMRNPEWSPGLFVSHRMALHTASVLGAGIYLLVMAGVAYYIRLYGGNWGTALQLVFLTGAVILLLMMMFSGQLRAYAKVFLSKHFFHYKYDYREEWLKFIATLSRPEPGLPLRVQSVRAMAELVDSGGGVLWSVNEHGSYSFAAAWNSPEPPVRTLAGGESLVRFLAARHWVVELGEYLSEPELYEGLELPAWLCGLSRAWLIVPLMRGDTLQGCLLLLAPPGERRINWEDRDLLKTAGRQAAAYLALLDTTEALTNAREFEAFNRLSAFVVHDLKNVAAQLGLVVKNAERHRQNPAFIDDALKTVENATGRMQRLLAQLASRTRATGQARSFDVGEALAEAVQICSGQAPRPQLAGSGEALVISADHDKFVAIVCHLLRNAQEATAADGRIELTVGCEAGTAVIAVSDSGCGMDETFVRESLFKPFRTTKGNAGMGVGVYEAREFAHALGGELNVVSQPGFGTTFTLRLPLAGEGAPGRAGHRETAKCAS